VENNDSSASRKRRGGPDGMAENDWICPKCENVNFSFRNSCNMKKCGAPRPSPVSRLFPFHLSKICLSAQLLKIRRP
jgi:hypothetical protein